VRHCANRDHFRRVGGPLVYGVFLLSVLAVLVRVVLITMEIGTSRRSLAFEVERVMRLPAPVTETWSEETVQA
jgi:hypothetical protein